LFAAMPGATQPGTYPLETSFSQGRALLARSVAAHGGAERINALNAVRLNLTGTISTGLQGQRPEQVTQPAHEGDFDAHWMLDFGKGRFRLQGTQNGLGGFVFPFVATWHSGTLTTLFQPRLSYIKNAVADVDEGREQSAGLGTRALPPVLLKLATQRMASIRDEGAGTLEGKAVRRLAFNADKNTRVTLLIDAETARLLGMEQLANDPLIGLDTSRWIYHGSQDAGGLAVPQRASVFRRGKKIIDIYLKSVQFDADAKLTDADFALDPAYPQIDAPALEIAELKPGLWEVSNAGGGFYRTQFFELADRVVMFDAPVSPSTVRAIVAKFREKVPVKPISHVVISHFHNDHLGGVRTAAELGAVVVTTGDVLAVARRIAAAQPPIGSLADSAAVDLKFATADGKMELGDAKRPLTVIELTGSPHVNRTLVLLDRGAGVAVGGDIYGDVGPFNAQYDWFAQWLRTQRDVELVAGTHHAPTPVKTILQRQTEFRAKKP
jgi:glyoxylase-like metal-dependent hydrolase (beta-lactamase superfamily II)